jgi:hypothetical protein
MDRIGSILLTAACASVITIALFTALLNRYGHESPEAPQVHSSLYDKLAR